MTSSISQGRRWASAFAVSTLATLLALPTIAIAAPPAHSNAGGVSDCIVAEPGGSRTAGNAGNEKNHGAVDCGEEENADDTQGSGNGQDNGQGQGNEDGQGDIPGQGPVGLIDEICPTPLASFTPGGHRGVSQAIAITSQSFDGDATAWEHLGWEAASGTTISEIAVVHAGGVHTVSRGNDRSGVAEHVLEIIFCGEFTPEEGEKDAPIEDSEDVVDEGGDTGSNVPGIAPPTPTPGEGVETVTVPNDTTTPITEGTTPAPTDTVEDGTEVRGVVLRQPAPDRITPAPRTDQVMLVAADDGTEVLGVTLARTGTDLGGLAAAGALGLVAGGLVLLSTRRRETDEVTS
jgi:hypothetical protein